MGRKTERIFTKVSNIKEYMDVLKSHGDKVLYRYPVGNTYASMTYSQFHSQVLDIAAGFKALGLAGKRIAVIGPTAPEWVSSYLAVIVSGGVVIPMDKELDAVAIAGFLETAEAEAIVYGKGMQAKLAGAMECRLYTGGKGRTRMKVMKLHARDILFFAVLGIILAAVIYFNTVMGNVL